MADLVEKLLAFRKKVRKVIDDSEKKVKELKNNDSNGIDEEIERLETLIVILDKRQIALKTSANSMYGAMGVGQGGKLPLLEGAESVTANGRLALEDAKKLVKSYNGEIIYGDTDSTFVQLPKEYDYKKKYQILVDIANKSKEIFPSPMKLEFEGKIYYLLLLLSKKRYICISRDNNGDIITEKKDFEVRLENGKVKTETRIVPKLTVKGVSIKRRDFCTLLKIMYERLIYDLFENYPKIKEFNIKEPHISKILTSIVFDIDALLVDRTSTKITL